MERLLVNMCESEKYGYYHVTNEGGDISWYDFCFGLYKQYGLKTKVIFVTTEEKGLSKAARLFNNRLDKSKKQFLIPKGFAHGFLVPSDEAEFCCKCDDFYNLNDEGGLAWNDSEIGVI